MSAKVRKIYDKLHNTLYTVTHDQFKAYDLLLAWLLCDNCPPFLTQFKENPWMIDVKNEFTRRMLEEYTMETVQLIRNDYEDELGNLYMDLQSKSSAGFKGQFLTPMHICDMMTQMVMGNNKKERQNVLDPCVGTGRFFMAGARVNKNNYYFGIDIDQRAVRTALVNCALHDIHGILLHADSLMHATNAGHSNWKYANQWDSHWDKLLTIMDEQKLEKPSDRLKKIEGVSTYNITENNNKLIMKLIDIKDPKAVAERRAEIQQAVSLGQIGGIVWQKKN